MAELVRDENDWKQAEIAFAVADRYHARCVGSALVDLLADDARASGVTHVTATMQGSNRAASRLVHRIASAVDLRYEAGEATLVAALGA